MSAQVAAPSQDVINEKFNGLKALLSGIKGADGQDLFSHLQEVFKKLILHYPDQALEKLEEVSYLLKHAKTHQMDKFLKISEMKNYKDVCEQMVDYIKIMKQLFAGPPPDEDGNPTPIEAISAVPDLLEDAYVYQWAGVGFGQAELYRLQKSLIQLQTKTAGAKDIRFFGKIRGTQKDYYVAEGDFEGEDPNSPYNEDNPAPAEMEPKGSGVNKKTYWVACSALEDWAMLPDLEPQDIVAARSIKVLFTGSLERDIITNPFFFRKEKHYLRAQIARIHHSTTLCPAGLFKVDEEGNIVENTGEDDSPPVVPSTNAMADASKWVHQNAGILKSCRTVHPEITEVPDGSPEEVTPESLMKEVEKADPYEPKLKSIVGDNKVCVSKNQKISPWIVKLMGDKTEYASADGKQTVSNGVVVVRSLQWPGSFNFFYHGKYSNIYVGNGHKYEEVSYFPVIPPVVQADPDEYPEQAEPNAAPKEDAPVDP